MADIKAEIGAQVEKMHEALLNKKQDEILDFYTEDCRVLPPNAPMVTGKEALKTFFGLMVEFFDKIGKVDNTVVDVVAMGEMASSVNTAITYDKDGKVLDNAKSMTVWKKVSGNWLVHWTTWNSDKPMPAK